jgi:NAD(P)-dependent dehydrogenase (short-subunit alcohol dehydrogenase family)
MVGAREGHYGDVMKDRHVLITGGTGGLGVTVTREALARGARVTVPYFHEKECARLDDVEGDAKKRLTLVAGDLTEESEVEKVVAGMDRLDALVHLVGGFTMGATEEVTLEGWRSFHDMALTSTFLCCKHALRRMKEAGYGRIVTIGSKAVDVPMAQMATYSSAKAGVVALTRVIAEECKGTNITANCVLPSIIDTEANRAAMGDDEAHKWVTPASLAEPILFLASEAAGDIRGAAVPVYGDVG